MKTIGFSMDTLDFFSDIRYHNEISYFEENRARYMRHVRDPFVSLIDALAPTVLSIDPDMDVRPNACLSRIRRDVRFAKNQPPYRDHMWLGFRHRGVPKQESFILYFDLYIDSANIGLGCYGYQREVMELFRADMTARPERFRKSLKSVTGHFEVDADMYKRRPAPETFPEDLKGWYPAKNIHVHKGVFEQVFSPDLPDIIARDFLRLKPMYEYMHPFFAQAFGYA